VDHRTHFLSQRAASKTNCPAKLKNKQQTEIKHRLRGGGWNAEPAPEKKGRAEK
jgi:hypothetical protein